MKLSQVKEKLQNLNQLSFKLPNGKLVPAHFHITEVGLISKKFIDCGGTMREEQKVNFQLWNANDYDHRLHPEKLLQIINLAEKQLGLGDFEIEVEYQAETIGKYALEFKDNQFLLSTTQTDCLAKDNCGIPADKPRIKMAELANNVAKCAPNSGCC
jgi:hypothetical protein